MTKYVLINCYSDNNKGDLGIIQSTIDYIKKHDENADVACVSTYNASDPNFESEHVLLKKDIKVNQSIFGELNIGKNKSEIIKIIRFIFDTIRIGLACLLPVRFTSKVLFSKYEQQTLSMLRQADYIISKGGSFICNEKRIRDKIALIRFLYIFLLSFKLKKKVIILNQSIGPVYGKSSIAYVNYILSKCHKVVLRENMCIKRYPYLRFPSDTIVSNDIAFFLRPESSNFHFDLTKINIGFTIKYVEKTKESAYRDMIKDSIEHIIEKYQNCHIYIYSQVPIDKDIEAGWEIYKMIKDEYKNDISFITQDYSSRTLKYLYSQMTLFIGTRLHSTIFAMGEAVPSICISYHGTKAEGIFSNMKSSNYVISDYNSAELIRQIDDLYQNLDKQKNLLRDCLKQQETRFSNMFKEIFCDN